MEDFLHKFREFSLVVLGFVLLVGLVALCSRAHQPHEAEIEQHETYLRYENDEVICYNFLGVGASCKWKE